jgi:hypothetical protein
MQQDEFSWPPEGRARAFFKELTAGMTAEEREQWKAQVHEAIWGYRPAPMRQAVEDIPEQDVKAGRDWVAADHELVRRNPRAFGLLPARKRTGQARTPRRVNGPSGRPRAAASRSSAASGDSPDDDPAEPPAAPIEARAAVADAWARILSEHSGGRVDWSVDGAS